MRWQALVTCFTLLACFSCQKRPILKVKVPPQAADCKADCSAKAEACRLTDCTDNFYEECLARCPGAQVTRLPAASPDSDYSDLVQVLLFLTCLAAPVLYLLVEPPPP
jgi:hypothetical protein